MRKPQKARPHLIGQTIDGKYKVRSVLGEGGMGTVFEALHQAIGRSVAVKVLNPAQAVKSVAVKRFHQEARAAGSIGHPNICEVYDMGALPDGSPYIVMERLTGQTLAERISEGGGLAFDEVIDVVIQVLSGLVAAHERGILHRDIKPENVFLTERVGCPPIAKLLDFGVSKTVGPSDEPRNEFDDLTKTGMVMGTPYYMSPEQARGQRDLDTRVDLYACGVLLYESLTGRRPFSGTNYNALLLQILSGKMSPPRALRPAIPEALEEFVLRSMAKERDERFASAAEMQRRLVELRDQLARRGQERVVAARAAAPRHGTPSSSIEIPVTFEPENPYGDDNETTTIPSRRIAPEPHDVSAYDDDPMQGETAKMDASLLYRKHGQQEPQVANEFDGENTAKMDQNEVEMAAIALREARERERAKKR